MLSMIANVLIENIIIFFVVLYFELGCSLDVCFYVTFTCTLLCLKLYVLKPFYSLNLTGTILVK